MVKAKPLVVLFAKSGIGKSSLINAGLEPLIEKDFYKIIKIRFQSTEVVCTEMVKNELAPFLNKEKLNKHSKGKPGLWEYLRACEFKKGDESVTPVLVFDQFEEYFEHSKQEQDELNSELADMVSDRLPERIRESLRAIPFRNRTKADLDWHSPIPVKFVFAIRSDRMSLMDEMSKQIPSILHNRFHLKPLGIEAAKEAIVEPAALKEGFNTPPFTYSQSALSTMLDYLKNDADEIESFQLQLLCRNIERTVQKKGLENVVVEPGDFGGKIGIKSILNNYYEQEIGELKAEEQSRARKFIEEGLIVAGRRVGVSEGVEKQTFNIDEDLLTKLLASRLIRAENTHLGRSYELSHDTLVAPILQSYEVRRRKEERKKQDELLAKERKRRNRAVLWAIIGFVAFIISLLAGIYMERLSRKAEKERAKAEKAREYANEQREKAQEALAQVEEAQIEMARTNLENGKSNLELGNYEAAVQNFNTVGELQKSITDSLVLENTDIFDNANRLKTKALQSGNVREEYIKYMQLGAKALEDKNYRVAYLNFNRAKKLNVNSTSNRQADLKLGEVTNQLVPQFKEEINKAETFIRAGSCDMAKKQIQNAEAISRLLPNSRLNQSDRKKLKQLKNKCY